MPLTRFRTLAAPSVLAQLALFAIVAGCDDLGEFKTGRGTVFRGEVVGSDSEPEQSSFIRKGFASHTQMELQFDPYAQSVLDEVSGSVAQGRVHTFVCERPSGCNADDAEAGPFDRARLEPIENLTHDALSEYSFPGGRLRNYIFGTRFATDGVQRHAMLFVSLMESGKIEVRAISPSVLAPEGESEQLPALFGVFVLDRQTR
jgi:hypothetical protein